MSKENQHNDQPLSADDLHRYRSGQLDAAERHRIERLLLKEPLYDEALEGFELLETHQKPLAPAISDLQQRLQQRVKPETKERRLPVGWWAAAASVTVLLGAFFFWYLRQDAPQRSVAVTPQREAPAVPQAPPTSSQPVERLSAKPLTPALPRQRKAPQTRQPTDDKILASPPTERVADTDAPQTTVSAVEAPQRIDTLRQSFSMAQPKIAMSAARQKPFAPAPMTVSGRVIDAETKEPLPGVTISFLKQKHAVVSDSLGRFESNKNLRLLDSAMVSYIGYKPKIVSSKDLLAGTIALKPDPQVLNEVIIVGYGTQKKADITGSVAKVSQKARPATGFAEYVRSQKKIPLAATENQVSGTVKLRFKVRKNGTLTQIRVVKGLGYGCDEEAIRLIRESPRWQPAIRKNKPISSRVEWEIAFP
ncbi:energy transducer TonB [Tellurirhabdus bombi]|uniref:energy transducer TonB n=1 Tax=Tellurirhabdus bombi TaxID=2907205 RepID=UPI001F3B18A0|nr:energy transducer TonB [Tellurirhabdus bombi]